MSAWALRAEGRPLSDKEAWWALEQAKKAGSIIECLFPNGKLWVRHGKQIVKQVDGKWYLCKP